jgi:hypothetical protein
VSADGEQNVPEEKPRSGVGRWGFLATSQWLPTTPDFADDLDDWHDEKYLRSAVAPLLW